MLKKNLFLFYSPKKKKKNGGHIFDTIRLKNLFKSYARRVICFLKRYIVRQKIDDVTRDVIPS